MATDQARIIGELYDAAVEPGRWQSALDSLASALGGVGAGYMVLDTSSAATRFLCLAGPCREREDAYRDYFVHVDPYRKLLGTRPLGEWYRLSQCFPSAVLRGDEWYNDFLLPSGVDDLIGAALAADGRYVAKLAIQHGLKQKTELTLDQPRFGPLLDALGKAVRLHCTLDRAGWKSALALKALDRIATAVIVTEESGRVVECNAAAERILRLDDGLGVRGGILTPRRAFEVLKLTRMIATAAARSDQGTGHMLIGRSGNHAAYVITVAPLGAEFALDGRPLAMILVADPDEHAPAHNDLAELFGFSPAESRLAAALMEGRKLDQITGELGVRITTLRTQLSSILKKVGVERQADLIRVLSAVRLIDTKPDRP